MAVTAKRKTKLCVLFTCVEYLYNFSCFQDAEVVSGSSRRRVSTYFCFGFYLRVVGSRIVVQSKHKKHSHADKAPPADPNADIENSIEGVD
jgi:hypothetical protein